MDALLAAILCTMVLLVLYVAYQVTRRPQTSAFSGDPNFPEYDGA